MFKKFGIGLFISESYGCILIFLYNPLRHALPHPTPLPRQTQATINDCGQESTWWQSQWLKLGAWDMEYTFKGRDIFV